MSRKQPKGADIGSASNPQKKPADSHGGAPVQEVLRVSGEKAEVVPPAEPHKPASESVVRTDSLVRAGEEQVQEDKPEPAPASESEATADEAADDGDSDTESAFDSATPLPVEEPVSAFVPARKMQKGDSLRCAQFSYLGQTHDIRGIVVSLAENDLVLELPTLGTLWPVLMVRVSLSASPMGTFVGSWQHVESDYPKLGEDVDFDARFRKSALDESKSIMAKKWNPPRKARAGYTWVLVKLSLQMSGFNAKGELVKRFSAGEHAELSTKAIADIAIAVEPV
jgi:hypothetical protein